MNKGNFLRESVTFCAVFLVLFMPFFAVQAALLVNPLKNITDIPQFIMAVVDLVLLIITPVIAVFLMYAGYLFVSAQGNESQITKAKAVFLWTCIGAAVVLGAKLFATAIQGTINSLT